MTVTLVYILGSSNSIVWSWFFWVYVHPVASVLWFVLCFFTLLISIEVRQLEKAKTSQALRLTYDYDQASNYKIAPSYQVSRPGRSAAHSARVGATEVIDVIVRPAPQLPSSKGVSATKRQAQIAMAQLPSSK